jgi:hypothetical protein
MILMGYGGTRMMISSQPEIEEDISQILAESLGGWWTSIDKQLPSRTEGPPKKSVDVVGIMGFEGVS